MDEDYDVIVLGTGLKECIISGLLSVSGKRVLHLDRNGFYGGESASLNLEQLWQQFRKGDKPPESFGRVRDYNVDLIPKFIMASGALVNILIHCNVTHYLEFKSVDGSYVFQGKKIYKVPSTAGEAMSSSLLSLLDKNRCKKFFEFVHDWEADNAKTHHGHDLTKMTMQELYKKFSLDKDAGTFIGHAIGLHTDDEYLAQPALPTVEKIRLYNDSLARHGTSPYLYPLFGLGELPQAFARMSAIHGGTYMLDTPVDEVLFNDKGEACGVRSGKQTSKCKFVVGDPSYFSSKVKKTGKVVRIICLLTHKVERSDKADSLQIIVPSKASGRKHDIYVSIVGKAHQVASKDTYLAIVSTTLENADADEAAAVKECETALSVLKPIAEQFVNIVDTYAPIDDGTKDKCFISSSFDPTSHFETTSTDVLSMYRRIMGKELDMSEPAQPIDQQALQAQREAQAKAKGEKAKEK